jgi:hypothetical protein
LRQERQHLLPAFQPPEALEDAFSRSRRQLREREGFAVVGKRLFGPLERKKGICGCHDRIGIRGFHGEGAVRRLESGRGVSGPYQGD